MQQYTVLAGMNGAGLMNCIYLPVNSVCIQMVPYKAKLNFLQYSHLLQSRGPYLEWHNTHEELHSPVRGDQHNNRPDTTVAVEEFAQLVKEALRIARVAQREELWPDLRNHQVAKYCTSELKLNIVRTVIRSLFLSLLLQCMDFPVLYTLYKSY